MPSENAATHWYEVAPLTAAQLIVNNTPLVSAVPGVIVSITFLWMLDASYGVVNSVLRRLGLLSTDLAWFVDADTAMLAVIVGLQFLLNRTKLGLAIRAVAQDEETARTMGINFTAIVLVTFAIGSGLAAFAGVMNGLYYNEINFGIGLYLGVVGFSAAIIGGLGSIYGAILGGFLFAGLQTIGTVMLPFASAYKDVFAFAVVIAIMAWRPTGLIREKISERV